jgi:hypothetical protein
MTGMTERIARAMAVSEGVDPDVIVTRFSRLDADVKHPAWCLYSAFARAAVEVMREPTEAMLDVGPGEPYMDGHVWGKMIDAALSE